MKKTELLFLGTDACIPEPGNDTASYLIDDELLVDVGWHVTENLYRNGRTPNGVNALFFTHMHHDHMMALPAFLYERFTHNDAGNLNIYGPEGLERAMADAIRFLQVDFYWPQAERPHIHVLHDGDCVRSGVFRVRTVSSDHAIPGLSYRFEDMDSGVQIGITGDGAFQQKWIGFFSGCDALIHEYSWGLEKHIPNLALHSDVHDAAKTAAGAGVGMLCPVHGPYSLRSQCEEAIRAVYSGTVYWPRPGDRLIFCK